jgi:predicted permease
VSPGNIPDVSLGFVRDTVRSLRTWRRTPGSALLVILALGLSGGALMALVSMFNALFWRELPVTRPHELVRVSGIDSRDPDWRNPVIPVSLFASLDRAQTAFNGFAGFQRYAATGFIKNTTQRLAIDGVSGRYFEALGVRPALGEFVGPREVNSAAPVAIISSRFWQARFGGDPNVVGQSFRLQGEVVTVIGVAPSGFDGLEVGMPTDAWVPASLLPRLLSLPASQIFFTAFGRLGSGITLEVARSQLETLWPPARQASAAEIAGPLGKGGEDYVLALEPHLESAARGFSPSGYRSGYRRPLVLLVLLCAMTLVLACANLSGLLLARWSGREGDLAVQAALGASHGRLVSQVVGESLALSMLAVVLSAPVALWSAKSLTLLIWNQSDGPSPLDLSLDHRILGVMVGLACVVAICVSLLPAIRVWSAELTLARGTRGLPGHSVTRWGRRLVVVQVALSVPLLVTTWVVAANLHRLEGVNTGFQPGDVIVASVTRQSGMAPAEDPVAYLTRLGSALQTAPGITAAALSWNEPLSFSDDRRRRPVTTDDGLNSDKPFVVPVSPGFFQTLSVPIVAGRDFRWGDAGGQRGVAVMTAGLAASLFPGADPLGQTVRLDDQPDRPLEVIGVVADAKLAEPHATNHLLLFTAMLQQPLRSLQLQPPVVLLKSPLPLRDVDALARGAVVPLGREDIIEVHPLRRTLDAALLRERAMRLGASYFAGLTTLLVFVGLYAVVNLGVTKRVPEIGLRIALGATTRDIRMMLVREACVTAAAGLGVGVLCAFLFGPVIASSLTLVGSHDPLALIAAIGLIVVVSALSVLIPLRRASRIAPVDALASQ